MELSTTSRGTGHEVELDVTNQQGPFHDAIIVIFDVDLTAREAGQHMDICQIAACCNDERFNVFIMPDAHRISPDVASVHGITIRRNTLLQNNNKVPDLSPREGLKKFLDFLSNQTGQTRKVLLAAHNCSSVQRYVLVRQMKKYNLLDSFQSLVLGTIDTLQVSKTTLNGRVQEKKPFDLAALAKEYLPEYANYEGLRDATVNVNILASLIKAIGSTDAMMKQHAKDLDEFLRYLGLVEYLKGLTPKMINKIAEAGISIDVLKDEYRANGVEGISMFLQEEIAGHPRVTRNLAIIANINARLSELFGNGNPN